MTSLQKYMPTLILLTLSIFTIQNTYAQKYFLIGSDSNNCQVHPKITKKGYDYVTVFDCLCMQKSEDNHAMQWVIHFGGRGDLPLGCYPNIDMHHLHNKYHNNEKPINCKIGDHCTQYECLELLYEDNKPQSQKDMTLEPKQCVGIDKQPLDRCDAFGRDCDSSSI